MLRLTGVIWLLSCAPLWADVFSYECDVLPPDGGWEIINEFCDPDQWVDGGQLFQYVELCPGYDPPAGQQFDYSRSLSDYVSESEFFVEWRIQTTGNQDEIPWVAPAALAIGGFFGVSYHFTISRDLVRLIRDNSLPFVWVEVDPNMYHTYRLELYGSELYVYYVDGELIDMGVPEGEFPNHSADVINIRARAQFEDSTTQWDYIHYGPIAQEGSGDYDVNGQVDWVDLYFFQECFSDPQAGSWPGCSWADFDFDSDVDCDDWQEFLGVWTDLSDPPILSPCDCPVDIDGDAMIGITDLLMLLSSWGSCAECASCAGDIDGNCIVDVDDLLEMLANWGPCT